jgi:hypothetical protein
MWRDVYTTALGLERATAMLARALGVDFTERHSVLVGEYFQATAGGTVVDIKVNYSEDGEPVDPDVPEGVYVTATHEGDDGDPTADPLRTTLGTLAYLRLLPPPPA